jgi:tetratricopeptide (TPR) repeat protein
MAALRGTPVPGEIPPPPSPAALRLASGLSVATRIEPELMRSMRLAVFPEIDVGAESDLWFSDWVGMRNPGGIVFVPQVLPLLRAGLRRMLSDAPNPTRLADSVWEVISRAHQNLSPALFLEEHVTWLAVTGGGSTEVEEELRQALVALASEGRTGIAGWLADAWRRFPPEVLATTTAWQLGTVAARYANFGPPPTAPSSVEVADIAAVAHALGDVPLPLLRKRSAMLMGELSGPGVAAILVPDTDPVIVEVETGTSGRRTVRVPRGEVVRVDLADLDPVAVRNARGTQYVVAAGQPPAMDTPLSGLGPVETHGRAADTGPAAAGWSPEPWSADPDALDTAITRLSAEPAPSGDELQQLGRACLDRFLLGGDVADLDAAITACELAVAAAETLSVGLLASLAEALHSRFVVTGDVSDLTEAKGFARRAVDASPPGERNAQLVLAAIQFSEFQATGDMAELDGAVLLARETAQDMPSDDPAYPLVLTRIAELLIARFGVSGAPGDIDEAVDLIATAVRLSPAAHPQLGAMLNNLANSLLVVYRLRGDPEDLRLSIDLFRRSAAASPSPQRPIVLAALAAALRTSFELTGDRVTLDGAVAVARAAATEIPADHVSQPLIFQALGNALQARFAVTGALEDLNEAINVLEQASATMRPALPGRPGALANLAGMLLALFSRTSEQSSLYQAMTAAREAADHCPVRSPYRTACLTVLADTLYAHYQATDDSSSLEEANAMVREAIAALPDGSPARAALFTRLADMQLMACQRYGVASYLDQGEAAAREAVATAPAGTPAHARALSSLASLARERYSRELSPASADAAIELWATAAHTVSASVSVRVDAAIAWAELAVSLGRWPIALSGYQVAVELLPLTAWRGSAVTERAALLGRYARLGQDAAACALRADRPERALEMLEQCRGLFWEHALDTRTDLARLREADPGLAERLYAVRDRLDAGERSLLTPEANALRLSDLAVDERYALAGEWDELLYSVRTIPGFESFLRPLSFGTLLSAAYEGPVIVINVSRIGCDALILGSRGLSVIPLQTEFSAVEAAAAAYSQIGRELYDQTDFARVSAQTTQMLAWLWEKVVQPVLDALDLPPAGEGEPLSRVWWCPTGAFTALPLHAAGHSSPERRGGDSAMDCVCSSYTPTLRALIEARAVQDRQQDVGDDLLIIENPSHPQAPYLRFGRDEVAAIQQLLGRAAGRVLEGAAATKSSVIASLGQASALHFIGHAIQRPDPAAGGLLLSDGILTLAEISALRFRGGTFAYLSACDTALTDTQLPDVVTLAAAFHVCGFRNVIAVLTVIDDRRAADVGVGVYRRLFLPHGYLRAENLAQALHGALRDIRDRNPSAFPWYAAFIHIGP